MKIQLRTLLFVSLIAAAGCNYTAFKTTSGLNGSETTAKLNKESSLNWDTMRGSVLKSCMACHLNHTFPELGDLNSVRQHLSVILTEVSGNQMPPPSSGYAPLDNCQKAALYKWSELGTPETSSYKLGELTSCQNLDDSSEPVPLAQLPLTYQNLLTRILQPRCIKCHNPTTDNIEAASILFYPYEEITNRSYLWEAPGADSKMAKVLRDDDPESRMPPPEDSPALSEEEVSYILRWIDAGKPR